MSKLADEMLRDIEKDTVDWDPNFDETRKEPKVLPSRFPNLLVNGSSGIAVGMATNIPPHNLREVINAVICVLDDPEAQLSDLMEHIKGPRFSHPGHHHGPQRHPLCLRHRPGPADGPGPPRIRGVRQGPGAHRHH